MKRSAMKRSRKPLRKIALRTEAYRREFIDIQPTVYARARGACQVCLDGPGTVVHHRKLRSQGGTNDPANLLLLCAGCHDYVHGHPALSYAAGYLLHQWEREVDFVQH